MAVLLPSLHAAAPLFVGKQFLDTQTIAPTLPLPSPPPPVFLVFGGLATTIVVRHCDDTFSLTPPPPFCFQVFGGLVTGMVVKYCDNILKNFALAISVILTVLVAIPLFGQVGGWAGGNGWLRIVEQTGGA